MRYLEILLGDRKLSEAAATSRKVLALHPSPALLEEAAGTMLAAEQYSLANNFLQQGVNLAPSSNSLKLDRAIVAFHVADAQTGLQELDVIPQEDRSGDYYLARMQMLEALGKTAEADAALKAALNAKPMRPDLYRQTALLLIKKQRTSEALRLLDEGGRNLPNDPDISLIRSIAMESGKNSQQSEAWLNDLQNRWPESYRVWSQTR